MLDEKKIAMARADGVCFMCSMCSHWHDGESQGLMDDLDDTVCTEKDCRGPVWGGSFPRYNGPISGYKHNHCYLCGEAATHHVWANGKEGDKIGLCKEHVLTVEKYTARKVNKGHSLVVAGHVAGPSKFEVGK